MTVSKSIMVNQNFHLELKSIFLDAFSSRSSSLFNYFANLTNFEQTWDQYQTASTQTQNNISEDQDGEWVWVPKGSKYQILDDDITYQDDADDRQDFLSLFNPSQLVFDNNILFQLILNVIISGSAG